MTTFESILKRFDKGDSAAEIAAALDLSPSHVYSVLREHRPNRERKTRVLHSEMRPMILGLHKQKIKPSRIAYLLKISRQYVYRILSE